MVRRTRNARGSHVFSAILLLAKASLVAACVACSSEDGKKGSDDPEEQTACESARVYFAREVWAPVMGQICIDCHSPGGLALEKGADQLLADVDALPEAIRTAVRNNGGGYVNHALFWDIMTPGGAKQPSGALASAIHGKFGSIDDFQAKLSGAAGGQFGSGWGWLCVDGSGDLSCFATANQDSPIMKGLTPILGVDVWEHAYYLNYQNRRPDYLTAWWNVVNWDKGAARYDAV
jgi:Fe-Mn family superoxide dismutase